MPCWRTRRAFPRLLKQGNLRPDWRDDPPAGNSFFPVPTVDVMANLGALTLLRNSWLFKDLEVAIIERLGELCATRQCAKGEVVFVQGEEGDALYGVVAGEIRVSAN